MALTALVVVLLATVAAPERRPVERSRQEASVAVGHSDPTGAAAALEQLVAAIEQDRPEEVPASLRPLVANARALHVEGLSLRYVDQAGAVDEQGRWPAAVELSYRFGHFDAASVSTETRVLFAPDADGRTQVLAFGGGGKRVPLWLTRPVSVVRTDHTLVLAPDRTVAERYARLAAAAVPVVRRVLPGWSGGLVVEVPADTAGLEGSLGAEQGAYDGVAAVTASVDGRRTARSPVHVFVNPAVLSPLDDAAAQVVLSHEATHVATGAATTTTTVPHWLLEGFADYVALRDTDLPLQQTAGQILRLVREEGAPDHLPDARDFDSGSDDFGAEYEAAWLACRVLADAGGERALVALYDEVQRGAGLDASLRRHFGFGPQELTRRWRERLSHWAA